MSSKFGLDYAKRVAKCKKCQQQLLKGDLRMWRMVPNPFTADSDHPTEMKNYFHSECLFETLMRCRAGTKVIDSSDDIEGWDLANDDDKESILEKIKTLTEMRLKKFGDKVKVATPSSPQKNDKSSGDAAKPSVSKEASLKDKGDKLKRKSASEQRPAKIKPGTSKKEDEADEGASKKKKDGGNSKKSKESSSKGSAKVEKMDTSEYDAAKPDVSSSGKGKSSSSKESPKIEKMDIPESAVKPDVSKKGSKFDGFKLFCKLCDVIASVSKYTDKTAAVRMFLTREGYDGDLYLLLKFLIPVADHRVYNLKAKQLIKIFSGLFDWSIEELTESYNHTGDVSQTLCDFLNKSDDKSKKAQLTNQMVDEWLEKLSGMTREDEQQSHFSKICKLATCLELKYIIRLIMKDLRVNAGAKHMLEGVRKGAYEVFQNSRNLQAVIEKCKTTSKEESLFLESGIVLNTPVKPMLAEPCRSVEQAMNKCNKEMYAEIKYDGERLQLHKDGDNFTFFSRSLKPTLDHKVIDLNKAVVEAFPTNRNLIVDAEMLLVDTSTGKPLPFGTMGIHKKKQFADAVVCLFVFDCIYYDDRSLMEKPLRERRKFLEEHMKEVPNRVLLSNRHLVKKGENEKLKTLIWKAIDEGLEGLVVKDLDSVYEPGKRHWLKVKKDYLEEGAMADTADLIVLGAYYGTGSKGGMMSVFLMGVYDEKKQKFYTVTKCGNGHDDATLDRINKELTPKMQKISRTFENLPAWIECSRSLVPDFVAIDPKDSPVWEITGAEFSRSDSHTASGISIRFPRVTKIRDDKNWETATSLQELKKLYDLSKTKSDTKPEIDDAIPLYAKNELNNPTGDDEAVLASGSRKRKRKPSTENVQGDVKTATRGDDESDENNDGHTKKAKTPCKYGEKCYRKNEEHRKQFSHPD